MWKRRNVSFDDNVQVFLIESRRDKEKEEEKLSMLRKTYQALHVSTQLLLTSQRPKQHHQTSLHTIQEFS